MDLNVLSQKFDSGKGLNFAAIRLPDSKDIYFIYATKQPELSKLKYNDRSTPAFICSPYGAGEFGYVFDADAVYKNEELIYGNKNPTAQQENGSGIFQENRQATINDFTEYIKHAVHEIKKGNVKKVVAARTRKVSIPESFSAPVFFNALCDSYPGACVYYFAMNGSTPWMGASPEKLLAVNKNTLTTVALAGTLALHSDQEWSKKERDEQSITADFIRNLFRQNKLKGVSESSVQTIEAGELKHLCSVFSWKTDSASIKAKFHKLLGSLNPTPAVCGMPQMEAASFIARNEHLERRFYSGFVGFDSGKDKMDLYVNLRCMELGIKEASLYAGAGITADSDPEKEWEETGKKMETLSHLL